MARIVSAYLDLAELRAEEQVPMTMEDWATQFEEVLRLSRKEILTHAGTISAKIAEQHALSELCLCREQIARLKLLPMRPKKSREISILVTWLLCFNQKAIISKSTSNRKAIRYRSNLFQNRLERYFHTIEGEMREIT